MVEVNEAQKYALGLGRSQEDKGGRLWEEVVKRERESGCDEEWGQKREG